MREIDVAAALSRHIAKANPKLMLAASFFNTVCGQVNEPKKSLVEEMNLGRVISATGLTILPSRTEGTIKETLSIEEVPHKVAAGKSGADRGGRDVESDSDRDEPEVVVLEDTEMSVKKSSGDESRSRSSFGGGSSSSCHSRVSRKRAAEDSPEREHGGSLRQPFPGAISRGPGGCRLYVPTNTVVTSEGTMGAITEVEIIASAGGKSANILLEKPTGTTAESRPSIKTCAQVEASREPSEPVDEIVDERSLILMVRPIDESDAEGKTDSTAMMSRLRNLNMTIVAMDTRGDGPILPPHVRACATSFVTVNTTVNIPAGLLSGANTCTPASVDMRAPTSVNLRALTDGDNRN